MSAAPSEPDATGPGVTLVRTAGGAGLHLPECPHVLGSDVHVATPGELAGVPVCGWSQAEVDGVGRRYFVSLEAAMRSFGSHAGTEHLIRAELRDVLYDEIWVPHSGSYIALGLGGFAVAWVGKTYVQLHLGRFRTLPGYAPGVRRRWSRSEVWPSRVRVPSQPTQNGART